jgi:hypothetical protein
MLFYPFYYVEMDIDIVTCDSLYHDGYYQVPQVMTKDLLLLASRP